jgi:predicted nuclease with TOPRIM domain
MKAETHLTSLDKKVLNYMLENNLTKASTKRNKYILKRVDINYFEEAIKEFRSLQNDNNNLMEKFALTSAIIEANERLSFLQLNDATNGYLFNKQLVII